MRFQTAIASAVIAVMAITSSLSTNLLVAAQNTTTPPTVPQISTACQTCIVSAVEGLSTCGQTTVNPSGAMDPSQLNPQEKKCYCAIVSDTTWTNKCLGADKCSQDYINMLSQGFAVVKGQYCQGVNTAANSANKNSALGGLMATAAAVAVAQALL